MAIDSSIFAAEFSDMFDKFVRQQQKFQKSIEKTFTNISNQLSVDINSKKKEPYKNKNQEKYLKGRPVVQPNTNTSAGTRQVVQSSIKVIIDDLSKKAVDKLSPKQEEKSTTVTPEKKPKGIWEKIIGGLMAALGVVGGSMMLNSSGFDTSAMSSIFGGAGLIMKLVKPLKPLLKRLPLIGLLISLGEAVIKFKDGSPDKILSGLLDITAGIAYLFPGIGTAVGLGVDILNYFMTNKMDELKSTGGKFSGFGDLFKRMMSSFLDTPFIKWFVDLGDKAVDVWTNPGVESLYNFFEHIGLVDVSNFMHSLDSNMGAALGLKDSKGDSQSLTAWFGDWITTSIIQPIKDFFNEVTDMIADGILLITGLVGEAFDSVKKLADDLNPKKNIEEIARLEKETREGEATAADKQSTLSYKRKNKLMDTGQYTAEELGKMSPEETTKAYSTQFLKAAKDKKKEDPNAEVDAVQWDLSTKNRQTKNQDFGDYEMQDFSVSDEKINAIVTGDKVQQFSKSDTIIGFKEGEVLVKGIESLIELSKQQIQVLSTYLEKSMNSGASIIAPSTSNNNYSFNIESSVNSFRKMVN